MCKVLIVRVRINFRSLEEELESYLYEYYRYEELEAIGGVERLFIGFGLFLGTF